MESATTRKSRSETAVKFELGEAVGTRVGTPLVCDGEGAPEGILVGNRKIGAVVVSNGEEGEPEGSLDGKLKIGVAVV
jgi:hypothetical protein